MMSEAPSERTRVKRLNKRAKYDAETVHGILDAMPICNVGYVFKGTPYVTPTLQWPHLLARLIRQPHVGELHRG
jgi:uncharacterized protein